MKILTRSIFTLVAAFGIAGLSYATPPQKVELDYDMAGKTLSIHVTHPSKERDQHYIRKYEITKNQDEPVVIYRSRQARLDVFTEDVRIEAKKGDRIHVKLYCVDGGSGEADLTVQGSSEGAEAQRKEKQETGTAEQAPQSRPSMNTGNYY